MTDLRFTVDFHSPFLIATGEASDGYDASVDPEDALPADSVKGLMRSAARDVLMLRDDVVERVFGSAARPSPWAWLVDPLTVGTVDRYRVSISQESHAAVDSALLSIRAAVAEQAEFSVIAMGVTHPDDPAVLSASACAVHGLGAERRRGFGWVTISGGVESTPEDLARLTGEWRR